MTELERHAETTSNLLREVRDLIDQQGRRVQPQMTGWMFLVSASGFNLVLPPIPGSRLFVESFLLVAASGVTFTWGGTSGTTFNPISGSTSVAGSPPGGMPLAANGGVSYTKRYPSFCFYTEVGQGVAAQLSAGVQVGGMLTYWVA